MKACAIRTNKFFVVALSTRAPSLLGHAPLRLRVSETPQAETALKLGSKAEGSSKGVILASSELGAGAAARALTRLFRTRLPPMGELRMARVSANRHIFAFFQSFCFCFCVSRERTAAHVRPRTLLYHNATDSGPHMTRPHVPIQERSYTGMHGIGWCFFMEMLNFCPTSQSVRAACAPFF